MAAQVFTLETFHPFTDMRALITALRDRSAGNRDFKLETHGKVTVTTTGDYPQLYLPILTIPHYADYSDIEGMVNLDIMVRLSKGNTTFGNVVATFKNGGANILSIAAFSEAPTLTNVAVVADDFVQSADNILPQWHQPGYSGYHQVQVQASDLTNGVTTDPNEDIDYHISIAGTLGLIAPSLQNV